MNFKLRSWDRNDLPALVKYANNWKIARFLTDQFPHPYNLKDAESFIERATREEPLKIFAIEAENEAVGAIGVFPLADIYRKNAEMGYWLAEPFWGKGIMTRAIGQMVEYAFTTFDIDRVFAKPFSANAGSCRVLEKNHFVVEGRFENVIFKNGEYYHEVVYAIRSKDYHKKKT